MTFPAVHPGELLVDELTERGMTQADLARQTGLTPKHVNQVIRGKAGIGPEMAVALERVLGVSAETWVRLQAAYDVSAYRASFTSLDLSSLDQS